MLTPEPMLHLSIVTLESDLDDLTRAVADVGVLHLLDVRHEIETLSAIRPYDVADRLAHLDAVARTLRQLAGFLGIEEPSTNAGSPRPPRETVPADTSPAGPLPRERHVDPLSLREDAGLAEPLEERGSLAEAETRAAELTAEADSLRLELAAASAGLERHTVLQRHLRALAPIGVALDTLHNLRYVTFTSGLLPARNLPRLRESLAAVPHLLIPAGAAGTDGRLFVSAICLRPAQEVLDRALRGAQLERVEVPPNLDGTPEELLADVGRQIDVQRATLDRLHSIRRDLASRRREEVLQRIARIERERLLVQARGKMGRTERIALVTGWVPASLARRIEGVARGQTQGRCVLQWRTPEALDTVKRGAVRVPILLRNPLLIRPFEHLLRNYGLPQYEEVEPTAIMALTFLVMFGFMFGDIGQGAVLFAAGYCVYGRTFRYRDYALLLMECGFSATVFGFLYGSVFGIEHWLPALWLRPMEDMPALIRTAVTFGVLLLSLGFVLNLINAWRRRDFHALWERNGLLAALTYWTAAGLFLRRLIGGPEALTLGTAVMWLSAPLALIVLKDPLTSVMRARRAGTPARAQEVVGAVVQSVVEVMDTLISSVSNTATFIRLAAFALSHAGLFLAVFSLADVVAHTGAGTVGAAVVLVLGNILIIALEGLIVSIQGVRLEYYEFFSKFYGGGGEEYRPLRVAAAPSGSS